MLEAVVTKTWHNPNTGQEEELAYTISFENSEIEEAISEPGSRVSYVYREES